MKKKNGIKMVKYGTLICGFATFLIVVGDALINSMMKLIIKNSFSKSESSVVGIIGGADGPTAIFIASSVDSNLKYIVAAVFFALTIIGISKWRKLVKIDK